MTLADRGEKHPVKVADCLCPGSPHPDGDVVYLLPHLTLNGGIAASSALNRYVRALRDSGRTEPTEEEAERFENDLGRVYLEHQMSGWNVEDENGPVPFDAERITSDYTLARTVAEEADSIYSDEVLAPLAQAAGRSSRSGPTAASTSATSAPTRKPRKP